MRGHWHGCGPSEHGSRGEFSFGGRRGFSFGPEGFHFDFGEGRGRSGGWGRGGARNRKRMFGSGELRLVLLKLIADEPRHGYDLIRAIEELTHGTYAPSPGVVYPTLTMLQDMGLIEEALEGTETPRKAFAATAEGRSHLEEKADEIAGLIARLEDIGGDRRKAGGPPIRRAVGNLLSALWNRVTREDANEEALHEIAAILDEAAQKIERLK